MKKGIVYSLLILLTTLWFSCNSDDDSTSVTPPRPYAEVYPEDLAKIENFMDTHYVDIDANGDYVFNEIDAGQTAISAMPELNYKEIPVEAHDLTYKVYYLKLNEGIGENPTRVDSAFVVYKGTTFYELNGENYQPTFDQKVTPVWFKLEEVIRGWGAIIPEFKTGDATVNADGSVDYSDFGDGVMFLPSGLGYYNQSVGNIPSYSPLVFQFKLYKQRYRDHDYDKILSKYEYGDNFYGEANDTDGDGIPDYLDGDDDGDGYITKYEIQYEPDPINDPGVYDYYDFNSIPTCSGGSVKKHLDASCH